MRRGRKELQHAHLLKGNPARFWGKSVAIATVLGVGITAASDSVLIVDRIDCKGATDLTAGKLNRRSTNPRSPCRLKIAVFVAKVWLPFSGQGQRER